MILRWLLLIPLILVFAPGPLNAQPTSEGIRMGPNLRDARDTYYNKMYEDIEIFRRILGRELQPLYPRVSYPNVTSNPFTTTFRSTNSTTSSDTGGGFLLLQEPNTYILASPPNKEESFSSLEGVYLKGQGVVYSATLASLHLPAKSEVFRVGSGVSGLTIVTQESEWETIRRQVRKEKDKPKKLEVSKPPSLSEVLLKVLAENGHNFSQLGENESLTLVFTVHEASPSAVAPKSGGRSAKTESNNANFGSRSDPRSQQRDLELLGELHLKQGKYGEALEVFEKAIQLRADLNALPTLYRRQAQCYLALGQDEQAEAVLDQLRSLLRGAAGDKNKPPLASKPAAALPVKLIIAVLKKQLDEVKQGKITFEEFRRQARVETLRFDTHRPSE
jgi:hypothetical protein